MPSRTPIHIAIPEPTSPLFISDSAAYNQRSLPQYLHALISAGAIPIPIPLHETPQRVAKILSTVQGILLPGSGADVDPQKYGESTLPQCGHSDPARAAVDELLIQDAFNLHKPILGICHGAQTLNVWRNGTLIQDLETDLKTPVNHRPGREVVEAHPVQIAPNSRLAKLLPSDAESPKVNSSHHQAIREVGVNLLVSAVSPDDGVVEAVELDSAEQFVIAVQWHPERTYSESPFSRALFAAFVEAACAWQPPRVEESIAGQ